MGSYFEVDMGDMRSANSLFDLIWRDGTLRLHIPSEKPPIHYLVDSQTIISLTKMRNEILNKNQTTWANADTRIKPRTFYAPGINRKISIREMGGGEAFNDFTDHLGDMEDLKHEQGTKEAIVEMRSLIHGQRMGINSPDKPKISGSLAGRITKTLIYGGERKSETDLEIG